MLTSFSRVMVWSGRTRKRLIHLPSVEYAACDASPPSLANSASSRELLKCTPHHVERDWWGVHFNSSRDDTLFANDGGDASQVAYSTDGKWINLFRVQLDQTIAREKLANMGGHNYVTGRGGVEPNVHITPDKKWVVFTGQFSQGQRHVYAVEIEKRR